MSISLVYVTTNSSDEAARIGETLVAESLAASVNILGEVRSIYRCPCIVTWRLEKGNNAYLDWVRQETTQ